MESSIALPVASVAAERYQGVMAFWLFWAILSFVVVLGAATYFMIKYRRRSANDKTEYVAGNHWVEFWGIFITSVFVAVMFVWGWRDYKLMKQPQLNELEINVIGQKWSWTIQYPNGKTLVNQLVVPVNKNVKLIMTSKDVLHSFYIPAFRMKQDTVPGMYSVLRFKPILTGTFDLFCAEYCGTSHSGMVGKVIVLSEEDYGKWRDGLIRADLSTADQFRKVAANGKAQPAPMNMAQLGRKVYETKTCVACHSTDGSRLVGPSLKDIYGTEREIADGSRVFADENYLRESIMNPMKKVVKGYAPQMPAMRGLLKDEEVNQVIAYIKSLKTTEGITQ